MHDARITVETGVDGVDVSVSLLREGKLVNMMRLLTPFKSGRRHT